MKAKKDDEDTGSRVDGERDVPAAGSTAPSTTSGAPTLVDAVRNAVYELWQRLEPEARSAGAFRKVHTALDALEKGTAKL